MEVVLNGERVDYHDDDAIRSQCMAVAIEMARTVSGRNVRKGLESLLADVRFLFVKAQGLVFYHDARSHKFMPVQDVRELVEFVRAILGEPPSTNDSTTVPPPDLPDQPQIVLP